MKIYFEDGKLGKILGLHNEVGSSSTIVIDAKDGYTANVTRLDRLLKIEMRRSEKIIIYTNSLVALSNKYCWDSELRIPELYFRVTPNSTFIRVDKLTDKEIRQPHNLLQMYINNAFNIERDLY